VSINTYESSDTLPNICQLIKRQLTKLNWVSTEYWLRCPSSVDRQSTEAKDCHSPKMPLVYLICIILVYNNLLYWLSCIKHVTLVIWQLIFPKSIKCLYVNTLPLTLWHLQFQVPPVCTRWDSVLWYRQYFQTCRNPCNAWLTVCEKFQWEPYSLLCIII